MEPTSRQPCNLQWASVKGERAGFAVIESPIVAGQVLQKGARDGCGWGCGTDNDHTGRALSVFLNGQVRLIVRYRLFLS